MVNIIVVQGMIFILRLHLQNRETKTTICYMPAVDGQHWQFLRCFECVRHFDMWDIFCLLYLLVRKQIRGKMNHEWWWLVDMMSAQVCFPFKGLAIQLFWELIRCPSESGHLALNCCAIASRDPFEWNL